MPFDIATITYEQWKEVNRTLASVSLELNNCRFNETPMESKAKRKEEIKNAQKILSDVHKSTEEETTVSVIWNGVI